MTNEYVPTIGLEIHAELRTQTKMFCNSKNDADEVRPNVNICPVCMAHPGTLPVINQKAVEHVLKVGVALGSQLADYTEFDRKNYFYPDLPKGYQLSQFEYPLVSGGMLKGVAITRIHLEEDTASSMHDTVFGTTSIDYNRAGVPLMELVTEPVIHSARQAGDFGRELQLLLRYLGVSYADMEKGNMRLEANISVSNTEALGTKVEVKNINSFRAMERAVDYEINRQINELQAGGKVAQETRGWDETRQATFSQRTKEGSADYRYFPDPDLPSLRLSEIGLTKAAIAKLLPELPSERRARYMSLGIRGEDAELYVRNKVFGNFFEKVVQELQGGTEQISLASNYIANDLVSAVRETDKPDSDTQPEITISASNFAKIIDLLAAKKVSSKSGKQLMLKCLDGITDPIEEATTSNLFQMRDQSKLKEVVKTILDAHPQVVSDFKSGKKASLEFLVGQGMKVLRGAADPDALREEFRLQLLD